MNGHKLVFLDTNGVLNFSKHRTEELRKGRSIACSNMRINDEALRLVGRLVKDSNAKVVITSSWRRHKDDGYFSNLKAQLKNKAGIEIFDLTPVMGRKVEKNTEITEWFNRNKEINIDSFVIIDDEYMEDYTDNMVLCDREFGFSNIALYNKALEILNGDKLKQA